MLFDLTQLRAALAETGLGEVVGFGELEGGTSPVFRLDLADGGHLVLKAYPDDRPFTPAKDAYAATRLAAFDIPVTRFLWTDETRTRLPFRFAITNYLPGAPATSFTQHPDSESIYRQMGALLRRLHAVRMPGYGHLDGEGVVAPVASHAEYMRGLIGDSFARFLHFGADAGLAAALRARIERQFDAVVLPGTGPVFAHDDLHPGNVLVAQASDGKLELTGLLDFGNARAADPIFDLAKCIFCTEHHAPGAGPAILAGYGPIEHPEPEAALAFHTLLHRVTMWWWLRHVGAIGAADAPSQLIDDLRAMLED